MLPAVRLLSSRGLCYLAQTHLVLNLSFYLCFDTATTLPHYDWWNPGPPWWHCLTFMLPIIHQVLALANPKDE